MTKNQFSINKYEVGKRIKGLRTSKGMTLEQFGELFNPPASKSIVSRWEAGKSIPSNERLKVISDKFEVTTIYLLYGKYMLRDIHVMPENKKKETVDSINELAESIPREFREGFAQKLDNLEASKLSITEGALISQTLTFISNYRDINEGEFINTFLAIFSELNKMYNDYNNEQLETYEIKELNFLKNDIEEMFLTLIDELFQQFLNN